MNDVEFEKIMSFTPRMGIGAFKYPPLRDVVLHYFMLAYKDEAKANQLTKAYINQLAGAFITRKM